MTQASDSTQAILSTLSDNIGKLRDEVAIAISDIKKVDEKVERVNEKVNALALDVAVVKEKVNGLDARLDDTNARLDTRINDINSRIDTRINDTNSRLEKIEQRLNTQSNWFLGIFGTLVAGLLIFLGRLVFFTAVS